MKNLKVLIVIAVLVMTLNVSAESIIPEGMTIDKFKIEVSKANSYGFLSSLSTGSWKTCTVDYPYGTFYPTNCEPCASNEVSSNCAYSCFLEQMCIPCCYSFYSCSLWSCCNSRFVDKLCYCTKPATECVGGVPGDKKCEGDNLYKCSSSGVWEFYEDCDRCQNAQCISCTPRYTKKCIGNKIWYYDSCGNKDELKETCTYKCENGQCVSDPCKYITCEDKCQNSIRSYDGYCSNGECTYQTENCDLGCSVNLCAKDLCKGVICDDKCENSIWYYDGNCINGKCVYTQENCEFGCEDKPFLSGITGQDMCNDDLCVGVTCEDYCSENSLFYDGKCIEGKCTQFKEKPFAEECGKPWYQNTWFWIGGVTFIIVSVFGLMYWRRR